jgi:hypothetical protein
VRPYKVPQQAVSRFRAPWTHNRAPAPAPRPAAAAAGLPEPITPKPALPPGSPVAAEGTAAASAVKAVGPVGLPPATGKVRDALHPSTSARRPERD